MNTRSGGNFARSLCLLFVLMPLIVLAVSCDRQTTNSPINIIRIFEGMPDSPVPLGGWGLGTPDPYPKDIQQVFVQGEAMALGLNISFGPVSKNIRPAENITFSKYTFYNRNTRDEREVKVEREDLGPFEKPSVVLIAWLHPWPVPAAPGMYELRVYFGENVVASATFQVKLAAPNK